MLYTWGWVDYWVWSDFVLVPVRPSNRHLSTRDGWFSPQSRHDARSGNVIILALVGVLEQRLQQAICRHVIGLLGGWSDGWCSTPTPLPASGSGATFGLLGAYRRMAQGRNPVLALPGSCSSPCSAGLGAVRLTWIGRLQRHRPHGAHRFCGGLCALPRCLAVPSSLAFLTVARVREPPLRPNVGGSRPTWSTCQPLTTPGRLPGLRCRNNCENLSRT